MGKQSKHMKHKCIFLNDLKMSLAESVGGKCNNTDKFVSSGEKTLEAYKKLYDVSTKSPLK